VKTTDSPALYRIQRRTPNDTIGFEYSGAASADSVAFDAGRSALSAVDYCCCRGVDFACVSTPIEIAHFY